MDSNHINPRSRRSRRGRPSNVEPHILPLNDNRNDWIPQQERILPVEEERRIRRPNQQLNEYIVPQNRLLENRDIRQRLLNVNEVIGAIQDRVNDAREPQGLLSYPILSSVHISRFCVAVLELLPPIDEGCHVIDVIACSS